MNFDEKTLDDFFRKHKKSTLMVPVNMTTEQLKHVEQFAALMGVSVPDAVMLLLELTFVKMADARREIKRSQN